MFTLFWTVVGVITALHQENVHQQRPRDFPLRYRERGTSVTISDRCVSPLIRRSPHSYLVRDDVVGKSKNLSSRTVVRDLYTS